MTVRRILAAMVLVSGFPAIAQAQPLVADLSEYRVAITTGFTEAKVLLFGAVDGEGEIVVVVHGPRETVTVRRKERTAYIWLNGDEVTFRNVPAFYQVMATEQPGDWLPIRLRERHQIGVEYLKLPLATAGVAGLEPPDVGEFRAALVRNKLRLGLYEAATGPIRMLSARLFRTDLLFPANVPTGIYTVEVFLVRDGEVVEAEQIPLFVSKSGVSAEIYQRAQDNGVLYGIAAVIFALFAGLGANAAFRKS